jgi:hypothetical protein
MGREGSSGRGPAPAGEDVRERAGGRRILGPLCEENRYLWGCV